MDIVRRALVKASRFGDVETVKYLLNCEGMDVETSNKDGLTLLLNSAMYNTVEVVKFLLDSGADISATSSSGMTALHTAAKYNKNIEVVKLFLDSGANIHAETKLKRTPSYCAYHNNKEMFKFCITYGYGVDEDVFDEILSTKPKMINNFIQQCLDTLDVDVKPANG